MKIADFGLSKSLKMPKPKRKDTSHGKHSVSAHAGRASMDFDSRGPSM